MANIVGYSSGYLRNTQANQPGVFINAAAGATIPVFEAKMPFPEKAGDTPITYVTCLIPITHFDGSTAVAAGDQFFVCPLPAGARVTTLLFDVTTAGTGTAFTVNIGNQTSATAYGSAISLNAAALTTVAQTVLDAAAVGASNTDAIVLAAVTVTSPTAGATVKVTVGVVVP